MRDTTFTIDQIAELRRIEKMRLASAGEGLRRPVQRLIASLTRNSVEVDGPPLDFSTNEVVSIGYPPGWALKPVAEQAGRLVEIFGSMDVSRVAELAARWTEIPKGMDGLAVIPKMSVIAAKATDFSDDWQPLNRAMQVLLAAMKNFGGGDRSDAEVGPAYLKLHHLTYRALAELQLLPGDCLVLPVQTGIRYRLRSLRDTRHIIECNQREFGLDCFSAGVILLVHPERMKGRRCLCVGCPGTKYAAYAGGKYKDVPEWVSFGTVAHFKHDLSTRPDPYLGFASAIVPA